MAFYFKKTATCADDTAPFVSVVAVTPSDSVNISADFPPRSLWVGTGGNISITMLDGTTAVIKNIANGTLIPGQILRVNAASTTASDIVALF